MKSHDRRKEVLEAAWVGDAVLTLFARQKILSSGGGIDQERAVRLTANRFLSQLGEASEVEARIGRLYESKGLEAAFEFISSEIEPLFLKSEAKLQTRNPGSKLSD